MDLKPLYDKSEICLACEHAFTTKKVRSRFVRALSTDTDFCSIYQYEEHSPLLYYVSVCPSCGYAFTEEADSYFKHGTLDKINDRITSQWRQKTIYGKERDVKKAIDAYKLAILAGLLKEEGPTTMAGLHMRLAWIYRKEENEQEERRFLHNAVKAYEQSYYQHDYLNSSMSFARIVYLIGELYRRLDEPKKAVNYFSLLIQQKNDVIEKRLVEMARDQWFQIREDQKRQVHIS